MNPKNQLKTAINQAGEKLDSCERKNRLKDKVDQSCQIEIEENNKTIEKLLNDDYGLLFSVYPSLTWDGRDYAKKNILMPKIDQLSKQGIDSLIKFYKKFSYRISESDEKLFQYFTDVIKKEINELISKNKKEELLRLVNNYYDIDMPFYYQEKDIDYPNKNFFFIAHWIVLFICQQEKYDLLTFILQDGNLIRDIEEHKSLGIMKILLSKKYTTPLNFYPQDHINNFPSSLKEALKEKIKINTKGSSYYIFPENFFRDWFESIFEDFPAEFIEVAAFYLTKDILEKLEDNRSLNNVIKIREKEFKKFFQENIIFNIKAIIYLYIEISEYLINNNCYEELIHTTFSDTSYINNLGTLKKEELGNKNINFQYALFLMDYFKENFGDFGNYQDPNYRNKKRKFKISKSRSKHDLNSINEINNQKINFNAKFLNSSALLNFYERNSNQKRNLNNLDLEKDIDIESLKVIFIREIITLKSFKAVLDMPEKKMDNFFNNLKLNDIDIYYLSFLLIKENSFNQKLFEKLTNFLSKNPNNDITKKILNQKIIHMFEHYQDELLSIFNSLNKEQKKGFSIAFPENVIDQILSNEDLLNNKLLTEILITKINCLSASPSEILLTESLQKIDPKNLDKLKSFITNNIKIIGSNNLPNFFNSLAALEKDYPDFFETVSKAKLTSVCQKDVLGFIEIYYGGKCSTISRNSGSRIYNNKNFDFGIFRDQQIIKNIYPLLIATKPENIPRKTVIKGVMTMSKNAKVNLAKKILIEQQYELFDYLINLSEEKDAFYAGSFRNSINELLHEDPEFLLQIYPSLPEKIRFFFVKDINHKHFEFPLNIYLKKNNISKDKVLGSIMLITKDLFSSENINNYKNFDFFLNTFQLTLWPNLKIDSKYSEEINSFVIDELFANDKNIALKNINDLPKYIQDKVLDKKNWPKIKKIMFNLWQKCDFISFFTIAGELKKLRKEYPNKLKDFSIDQLNNTKNVTDQFFELRYYISKASAKGKLLSVLYRYDFFSVLDNLFNDFDKPKKDRFKEAYFSQYGSSFQELFINYQNSSPSVIAFLETTNIFENRIDEIFIKENPEDFYHLLTYINWLSPKHKKYAEKKLIENINQVTLSLYPYITNSTKANNKFLKGRDVSIMDHLNNFLSSVIKNPTLKQKLQKAFQKAWQENPQEYIFLYHGKIRGNVSNDVLQTLLDSLDEEGFAIVLEDLTKYDNSSSAYDLGKKNVAVLTDKIANLFILEDLDNMTLFINIINKKKNKNILHYIIFEKFFEKITSKVEQMWQEKKYEQIFRLRSTYDNHNMQKLIIDIDIRMKNETQKILAYLKQNKDKTKTVMNYLWKSYFEDKNKRYYLSPFFNHITSEQRNQYDQVYNKNYVQKVVKNNNSFGDLSMVYHYFPTQEINMRVKLNPLFDDLAKEGNAEFIVKNYDNFETYDSKQAAQNKILHSKELADLLISNNYSRYTAVKFILKYQIKTAPIILKKIEKDPNFIIKVLGKFGDNKIELRNYFAAITPVKIVTGFIDQYDQANEDDKKDIASFIGAKIAHLISIGNKKDLLILNKKIVTINSSGNKTFTNIVSNNDFAMALQFYVKEIVNIKDPIGLSYTEAALNNARDANNDLMLRSYYTNFYKAFIDKCCQTKDPSAIKDVFNLISKDSIKFIPTIANKEDIFEYFLIKINENEKLIIGLIKELSSSDNPLYQKLLQDLISKYRENSFNSSHDAYSCKAFLPPEVANKYDKIRKNIFLNNFDLLPIFKQPFEIKLSLKEENIKPKIDQAINDLPFTKRQKEFIYNTVESLLLKIKRKKDLDSEKNITLLFFRGEIKITQDNNNILSTHISDAYKENIEIKTIENIKNKYPLDQNTKNILNTFVENINQFYIPIGLHDERFNLYSNKEKKPTNTLSDDQIMNIISNLDSPKFIPYIQYLTQIGGLNALACFFRKEQIKKAPTNFLYSLARVIELLDQSDNKNDLNHYFLSIEKNYFFDLIENFAKTKKGQLLPLEIKKQTEFFTQKLKEKFLKALKEDPLYFAKNLFREKECVNNLQKLFNFNSEEWIQIFKSLANGVLQKENFYNEREKVLLNNLFERIDDFPEEIQKEAKKNIRKAFANLGINIAISSKDKKEMEKYIKDYTKLKINHFTIKSLKIITQDICDANLQNGMLVAKQLLPSWGDNQESRNHLTIIALQKMEDLLDKDQWSEKDRQDFMALFKNPFDNFKGIHEIIGPFFLKHKEKITTLCGQDEEMFAHVLNYLRHLIAKSKKDIKLYNAIIPDLLKNNLTQIFTVLKNSKKNNDQKKGLNLTNIINKNYQTALSKVTREKITYLAQKKDFNINDAQLVIDMSYNIDLDIMPADLEKFKRVLDKIYTISPRYIYILIFNNTNNNQYIIKKALMPYASKAIEIAYKFYNNNAQRKDFDDLINCEYIIKTDLDYCPNKKEILDQIYCNAILKTPHENAFKAILNLVLKRFNNDKEKLKEIVTEIATKKSKDFFLNFETIKNRFDWSGLDDLFKDTDQNQQGEKKETDYQFLLKAIKQGAKINPAQAMQYINQWIDLHEKSEEDNNEILKIISNIFIKKNINNLISSQALENYTYYQHIETKKPFKVDYKGRTFAIQKAEDLIRMIISINPDGADKGMIEHRKSKTPFKNYRLVQKIIDQEMEKKHGIYYRLVKTHPQRNVMALKNHPAMIFCPYIEKNLEEIRKIEKNFPEVLINRPDDIVSNISISLHANLPYRERNKILKLLRVSGQENKDKNKSKYLKKFTKKNALKKCQNMYRKILTEKKVTENIPLYQDRYVFSTYAGAVNKKIKFEVMEESAKSFFAGSLDQIYSRIIKLQKKTRKKNIPVTILGLTHKHKIFTLFKKPKTPAERPITTRTGCSSFSGSYTSFLLPLKNKRGYILPHVVNVGLPGQNGINLGSNKHLLDSFGTNLLFGKDDKITTFRVLEERKQKYNSLEVENPDDLIHQRSPVFNINENGEVLKTGSLDSHPPDDEKIG